MVSKANAVKVGVVVGTGVAVGVIAPPVALYAVGFTKIGVAAGSAAAAKQTLTTAAGSMLALCQSAGVLGVATKTLFGVVAAASTVAAGVASRV